MAASLELRRDLLEQYEFIGELALSGKVRAVSGIVPAAVTCQRKGRSMIAPVANEDELQYLEEHEVFLCENLAEIYQLLCKGIELPRLQRGSKSAPAANCSEDMADVVGQEAAKRALLIAAAGGHNILFCGPPGTGKTMLARRILTLLPPLTTELALETAAVHSVAGMALSPETWRQPCFRAPHHTASAVALTGGGSNPRPGEVSLAHNGVLFLDEFTEFPRKVLDVLREPMESGEIVISRAARQCTYPAKFQLIAALNPSPSGDVNDRRSSPEQIIRYLNRISGPLLDRIDLQVDVPRLEQDELESLKRLPRATSKDYREQVLAARQRQAKRSQKLNAHLTVSELERMANLETKEQAFLYGAVQKLGLSMRSMHRVLKVSMTIADLDGASKIAIPHIAEALGYRALERLIRNLTR